MKYLIDTNVFIPLEPTRVGETEAITAQAIEFSRKANAAGFPLFLHPAQARDIESDRDEERRRLRQTLLGKYPSLANSPDSRRVDSTLGVPPVESHDWVDHQLLAALYSDAVDYLVTEDVRIHRKAKRLGLQHRVAFVADAIAALNALFDVVPPVLPAVTAEKAFAIRTDDQIFDSLRSSYPGFDEWLSKCRLDHRQSWVIDTPESGYAGVCIVNREDRPDLGCSGKSLKVCTFKISDSHNGFRYGELLLRHVLDYAERNAFSCLFIEVFPTQERLIAFLGEFGFEDLHANTLRGELRLLKRLTFTPADVAKLAPLEFNKVFGPSAVKWADSTAFVIPIKPKYHDILFPEATPQTHLFEGQSACGNALRKAYLCNAGTREISAGAIILFYRSEDAKAVTVIGVAEETLVSSVPTEVARFVGKRTVYPFREIEKLCEKEVLAILFRQARVLPTAIPLDTMVRNNIITAAPQSITKLSLDARKWIQTQMPQ